MVTGTSQQRRTASAAPPNVFCTSGTMCTCRKNNGHSNNLVQELHCLDHDPCRCTQRACQKLCRETALVVATTGMSTTASKNCNCRRNNGHVNTLSEKPHLSSQQRACQRPRPRTATVVATKGMSPPSQTCRCMITDVHNRRKHALAALNDLHNRDIGHLKRALQLRDLRSFLHAEPRAFVVEHNGHVVDLVQARIRRSQLWDLDCLHTDSTRGICWTCPTVTSNTLSMDCNRRITVVFKRVRTKGDSLHATRGKSTTVTTVNCACGVAQKRARQQPGPRTAPK